MAAGRQEEAVGGPQGHPVRRAVAVAVLVLLQIRGDLLIVAGSALVFMVLWTIDWRLAVAPAGAALIALGARL